MAVSTRKPQQFDLSAAMGQIIPLMALQTATQSPLAQMSGQRERPMMLASGYGGQTDVASAAERAEYYRATGERMAGDESALPPERSQVPSYAQEGGGKTLSYEEAQRLTRLHNEEVARAQERMDAQKRAQSASRPGLAEEEARKARALKAAASLERGYIQSDYAQ